MRAPIYKTITEATISANATVRAAGKDLPLMYGDRLLYHRGWLIEIDLTPTFTTNPGVVGHNNLLSLVKFRMNGQDRYALSGNAIRMFERHENGGKHAVTEAIQTASASSRVWARYIPNGPRFFANENDFSICNALLTDAELNVKLGALLDISGDTTVITGTIRLIAVMEAKDDIDIAPWFERREETVSTGQTLEGECLLAEVALCNSSAYGAITAGGFGSLTLETGLGNVVDATDARILNRGYQHLWCPGQVDASQGDAYSATDVNQRQVNLASPTALAVQTADLQTVLHYGPRQKIAGLPAYVRSNFKVKWAGTNTSAVRLVGRFLPIEDTKVGEMVETAARVLGKSVVPRSSHVKTISKKTGAGPFYRFFRRTTKTVKKAA